MSESFIAGLSALLVAGSIQAQAQTMDVQAELAKQAARIADLEKKAATVSFPEALTPYVLIDTTLTSMSNATTDGRNKVDFGVSYMSGCRWGLKGLLKTNVDDLNIIYKLESEYETPTGNMDTPNVLFNRDAWVGFSHKLFGQFTFGRQNTVARDFSQNYGDPYGHPAVNYDEGGWTNNNNNFKQMIYFAASEDGTRVNKGLTWKKVAENGWAMGIGYNMTSTEANTSTKNTDLEFALGYNGLGYNISGFYITGNRMGYQQTSSSVGGNVDVTKRLRLYAGLFHYTADQGALNPTRNDDAFTLSMRFQATPKWGCNLGYQSMKAKTAGLSGSGYMTNPFSDGSASTKFGTGTKNTAYCGIFRTLNRRSEAYLVADYMKLADQYTLATTHGHDSQTTIGIGIRIRAL